MPGFVLKGVGKRRDDVWTLRDVSCRIAKGETMAVFGPSGSGKSTLLKCLNRLLDIDEGSIFLDNTPITEFPVPELRRRVGMVFQFPAVFEGSVEDNIRYGMDLWGIDDSQVLKKALADANLPPGFLKKDAMKLSGGEQQRVCLARALAIGSEALLLDEPTSSLDSDSAAVIESTIMELKNNHNLTIVWVTHDRAQAARVADRIALLEEGRLAGVYSPAEFMKLKPKNGGGDNG